MNTATVGKSSPKITDGSTKKQDALRPKQVELVRQVITQIRWGNIQEYPDMEKARILFKELSNAGPEKPTTPTKESICAAEGLSEGLRKRRAKCRP